VTSVTTYWSSGQPDMVGAGGHATYAAVRLVGGGDSGRVATYKKIKDAFSTSIPGSPLGRAGITATVGGQVPAEVAINSVVSANIARAEMISIPVLVILLLIIFGSFVSALLPAAIGGIAIIGSFAVLRLLTHGTQVSVYSVNVTTIMGLGLGIDYGLFM